MKSVYKVRKVSGSLTITIPHEIGFKVGDYIRVQGDEGSRIAEITLVEAAE